ncbi:hypothetical protein KKF84_09135 [Myxococcota bacterium]|nr:hypothetical protein [Myxococcota bacterium]MBU1535473.1 hypothetical protein [Myxococcota bacterium]
MRNYLILVPVFLSFFLLSCDDSSSNNTNNNTPQCGNGILEAGEQCDGFGIQPVSCDSLVEGSLGFVYCNLDCTYDTGQCAVCVCGDDLACAPDAGGEECDGTDLNNKSCSDFGTFTGGTLSCSSSCTFDTSGCLGACQVSGYMEQCDLEGGEDECCPLNGMPSDCTNYWSDGNGRCLQSCAEDDDCGWNLSCVSGLGHHCYKSLCGEGIGSTAVNAPCAIGSKTGYCFPTGLAMDDAGTCQENGTASAGDPCVRDPYDPVEGETGVDPSTQCDQGFCMTETGLIQGACVEYCDPVAAAQGNDNCPENYNCLGYSRIYEDNPAPHPDYLFRTAEVGYCQPMLDDLHPILTEGMLTCNILTGLTRDASPCPTGQGCKILGRGSLMGKCGVLDAVPLQVGEACTLPANSTVSYNCEATLNCAVADPFNDPNPESPVMACAAICDPGTYSSNTACIGLTDGSGNPFVCLSLSRFLTEDHELPMASGTGTVETHPSPVGLCVPPPQ